MPFFESSPKRRWRGRTLRCWLHVGTEKTGTTTLQRFLDDNRQGLLERGLLYTQAAGRRHNRQLAVAAYDDDRRDDATRVFGVDSPDDLAGFRDRVVGELRAEIDDARKRHDVRQVVFSSEYFQSRLTRRGELERLKALVHELGAEEVRVIVYLRDPVEVAESLYSTAVKTGSTAGTPPPPGNGYFQNVCNHWETMRRLVDVFGDEYVVPRLFVAQELQNGSLVEDFLSLLGVSAASDLVMPSGKANPGLSAFGIELLRRVNAHMPRFVGNTLNPQRQALVRFVEKHCAGERYRMPESLVSQYEQAFEESNEMTREAYFPARERLFPARERGAGSETRLPERELEVVAAMLIDLFARERRH